MPEGLSIARDRSGRESDDLCEGVGGFLGGLLRRLGVWFNDSYFVISTAVILNGGHFYTIGCLNTTYLCNVREIRPIHALFCVGGICSAVHQPQVGGDAIMLKAPKPISRKGEGDAIMLKACHAISPAMYRTHSD